MSQSDRGRPPQSVGGKTVGFDGGIKLDKEKILTAIAPCSLCCHTCPGMKGGIIQETAIKLSHYEKYKKG